MMQLEVYQELSLAVSEANDQDSPRVRLDSSRRLVFHERQPGLRSSVIRFRCLQRDPDLL